MLKSRKKMLLSSIAMLLVALVALGSATFAWFTTNKNVSATGFSGKASSSLGLKILSESQAADESLDTTNAQVYKTSTTLNTNEGSREFTPVSMVPADYANIAAFTTVGKSEIDGTRATDAIVSPVTKPTSYNDSNHPQFYVEKVFVALSGNSGETAKTGKFTITSLSADFQNAEMAAGVRYFVYYHDPTAASGSQEILVGQYAVAQKQTAEITAELTAQDIEDGVSLSTSNVTYALNGSVNTNTQYNVTTQGGQCYFTIVAFLDGQDPITRTEKVVAQDLIQDIDLDLQLVV